MNALNDLHSREESLQLDPQMIDFHSLYVYNMIESYFRRMQGG